jgi:hypothetical protein
MQRDLCAPFLALAACVFAPLTTSAQEAAPAAEGAQRQLRIEDLPPPVRLGARSETVRRAWPVLPVVVVVADEVSYLEAIAQWRAEARFPVLIDDGSPEAREDIARFVRGFQPRKVVRWKAGDDALVRWGADAAERRAAVESVIYRMWSRPLPGEGFIPPISTPDALLQRWRQLGIVPPGIVVADVNDDAWPAAVALAVGRLQPIAWIPTRGQFGGTLSQEDFNRFASEVEQLTAAVGLSWAEIGDQLDSVTICLNIPAKVQAEGNNILATTDMLGRHRAAGEDENGGAAGQTPGARWAWAGQIAGGRARSAYAAMCSLFLVPTTAWLFDGYPDEKPWSAYDATAAANFLQQAGLTTTVDDGPRQDLEQWRRRTSEGISAGFIAVNSKGNGDEFHLHGGRGRPGDVPHLTIPSFVHFVHSFSASSIGARETVGARWLERGAYAYCGSVHEPFLHGFVPTPILAARLTAAFPWGAAVRVDDGPPWKIAVFGDPLLAVGPASPRVESIELPLGGALSVEDGLRESIEGGRFAEALGKLALLGRDQQATRLVAALLSEKAGALTADAADSALMSVFRAGDVETFVAVYSMLSPQHAESGWRRDALWHKTHPRLGSTRNPALVRLLAAHLRPDQVGRDAAEVATPYSRLIGSSEAVAMLQSARPRAHADSERNHIEQAITQIQSSPRFRNRR